MVPTIPVCVVLFMAKNELVITYSGVHTLHHNAWRSPSWVQLHSTCHCFCECFIFYVITDYFVRTRQINLPLHLFRQFIIITLFILLIYRHQHISFKPQSNILIINLTSFSKSFLS